MAQGFKNTLKVWETIIGYLSIVTSEFFYLENQCGSPLNLHYITPIWYCIILFSYIIIQTIISIRWKLCFIVQKEKITFVAHFQLFWMFYWTKRWNAARSNNTIIHLAIIHLAIIFLLFMLNLYENVRLCHVICIMTSLDTLLGIRTSGFC